MREALAFTRTMFARAVADARREPKFLALALLAVVVSSLLVDSLVRDPGATLLSAIIGLLTLYVQLAITFRMLDRHGAAPAGYEPRQMTRGRFPSAFFAGLLGGIGILIGLVLLVMPGLALMALWSLSTVVIAAEGLRATDALGRSWEIVRPAFGRVLSVGAVFVLMVAGLALGILAAAACLPEQAWLQLVFSDVAMPAVTLGSAVVWVQVYLALRKGDTSTT